MRTLKIYKNAVGWVDIDPVEAYTPKLENAALAIGELLVLMRTRGFMNHAEAAEICRNFDVEEEA